MYQGMTCRRKIIRPRKVNFQTNMTSIKSDTYLDNMAPFETVQLEDFLLFVAIFMKTLEATGGGGGL